MVLMETEVQNNAARLVEVVDKIVSRWQEIQQACPYPGVRLAAQDNMDMLNRDLLKLLDSFEASLGKLHPGIPLKPPA